MATHRSHPEPSEHHSLAQLTVRDAHADLLDVEPLDLGPGAPATIELERERGPQPDDAPERATGSLPVAYLDSSALVKLIAQEPETAALRGELARLPRRVSSLLAAIELTPTARRLGNRATPLAPRILAGRSPDARPPGPLTTGSR